MSDVKRYDMEGRYAAIETAGGDYVEYEDYERLSRENEVLREQNFAMNKTIAKQANALGCARTALSTIDGNYFPDYRGIAREGINQIDEAME